MSWSVHDSIGLERAGVRTVTVASDRFVELGRALSRALGRPDLALVVVPHPLAGLAAADAEERGRTAGRALLAMLRTTSLPPRGGGQGGGSVASAPGVVPATPTIPR